MFHVKSLQNGRLAQKESWGHWKLPQPKTAAGHCKNLPERKKCLTERRKGPKFLSRQHEQRRIVSILPQTKEDGPHRRHLNLVRAWITNGEWSCRGSVQWSPKVSLASPGRLNKRGLPLALPRSSILHSEALVPMGQSLGQRRSCHRDRLQPPGNWMEITSERPVLLWVWEDNGAAERS